MTMGEQIIQETESAGNLEDNDLLIFFRPGRSEEVRKKWSSVHAFLRQAGFTVNSNLSADNILDIIETTRLIDDRGKFLRVSTADQNALAYDTIDDTFLLNLIQLGRSNSDRGKLLAVKSDDLNALELIDAPSNVTADAVLDLADSTRSSSDRSKVLRVKNDDENALEIEDIEKALLDSIDSSRSLSDLGKGLVVDGNPFSQNRIKFETLANFDSFIQAGSKHFGTADSFIEWSNTAPDSSGIYLVNLDNEVEFRIIRGEAITDLSVAASGDTPSNSNSLSFTVGSNTIRIGRTASTFLVARSATGTTSMRLLRII